VTYRRFAVSLSASAFFFPHSSAWAGGSAINYSPQLAILLGGLAAVPILLYLGDGYIAIRSQPDFRIALMAGAAASLLLLALSAASLIGGAFQPYGAGALAMFLVGLIRLPPAWAGLSHGGIPMLGVNILITAPLMGFACAADAGGAVYVTSFAGFWYGAYMLINAFASPPVPGVDAKRMTYAGAALVAISTLLMAHQLGQAILATSGEF